MKKKFLFVQIFQPFAQFRNPFTFYGAQSFPLPPKTTIIGFLQNAVNDYYGNTFGVDKWYSLKVSVSGFAESSFMNYSQYLQHPTFYSTVSGLEYKKTFPVNPSIKRYSNIDTEMRPIVQEELFNVQILIFLEGDSEMLEEIYNALINPKKILYLGRSEDVVFVKKVKIFDELEIINKNEVEFILPTYLKESFYEKCKKKYMINNFPIYSIPVKNVFYNENRIVKHKSEISFKKTKRETVFERVIYLSFYAERIFKLEKEIEFYKISLKKLLDREDLEKDLIIPKEDGWI